MDRGAWVRIIVWVCAAVTLGGCISVKVDRPTIGESHPNMSDSGIPTGFINKTVTVGDKERRYVVYVPREYDPGQAWPLIVFLHGAGERGNNGLAQTEVGIGRAIRFWPERFPCVVVMPQCPGGVWWDEAVDVIDQAYEDTVRDYTIDPDRIYLTGLSMGGFGTWQYGAAHADRFAALMPICGGGRPEDVPKLATVPTWAFHGAKDDVVSPDQSRSMVEAVRQAGGSVQYTEYPDLSHNSWDAAYEDIKATQWMLKQKKGR